MSMAATRPPVTLGNRLLAALPEQIYARLLPELVPTTLAPGEVISEPYRSMGHIYFPTSAVVTLLHTTRCGATAAAALVGNDGTVGVSLFLGADTTTSQAVVEVGGGAVRMEAKALRKEFRRSDAFHDVLLLYTRALITQISHTAVCNRLHPIEQRLCRWLLLTRDRVESDRLSMTQESIARNLGVRREGVTAVAHQLQTYGLIAYARGQITILDRERLEGRVCECYWPVRAESDRLSRLGRQANSAAFRPHSDRAGSAPSARAARNGRLGPAGREAHPSVRVGHGARRRGERNP
ncbi:MAG TPA: Crp/Fnr family transcriptional regulator [Geminicoccaceae bacterium]|nr:Crp/Fnr family transcriptional regulator [Geminicoccaceae bacterium]